MYLNDTCQLKARIVASDFLTVIGEAQTTNSMCVPMELGGNRLGVQLKHIVPGKIHKTHTTSKCKLLHNQTSMKACINTSL